ncbi:methyl-accepting chemotaxis protein [Noviherbaspirillum aerium]|uniref:methyl-accepting chemotaxis protein n=1 Tax=Noviherbaspirillum aerium TaxID=2588497 RepID=UPI00298F9660|nr:methyl-accepting chemotaxis protein [Noviherbaspirillum aerium]
MLKNLKIGRRLGLAFGMLSLLMAAVVAFSLVRMGAIHDAVEFQNKVRTEKLEPLYAAREALAQTGLSARNALAIADNAEAARELDKLDAFKAVYLEQLKKVAPRFQGNQDFEKVSAGLLAMADELNKVRVLRGEATNEKLAAFIANECRPLRNRIVEDMEVLLKSVQKDVDAASRSADDLFEKSMLLVIAVGAVLLAATAVVGVIITSSITRPLAQAVSVAEAVAAGDLTSRIEVVSSDETGQLQRALKQMNENLLNMIGAVRAGADTIASSSQQIASGNLELSGRTEQQAASLQETASSMEELTSTVKQNADNARQANQLAASASSVAAKGGEVVAQVVDTMESINASSRKIVDIISVIDGIAFQTNILALNAAVEAARAGEQGRGFAVVASEVRNLAQRSAGAAKEIKQLISDSVDKIDAGSRLVTEAGSTMEDIVASVQRVTGIMSEIMMATEQQSSGIEQVNYAITQMDNATQQNAALVEEAAGASQAMQQQAANLAGVVSVFKLDGAHPVRPSPAGTSSHATPSPALPTHKRLLPAQSVSSDSWQEF